MIKQVTERPKFHQRIITHNVMFCDGCGARIIWAPYDPSGKHYCDKCLEKKKEKK